MVKKSNSQSMALHLFDTMLKVFEKKFLKLNLFFYNFYLNIFS